MIIGRPRKEKDDDDEGGSSVGSGENNGTLILDATCAPQEKRFPTGVSLLNEARLNAERIIDVLHKERLTSGKLKSPTYREEVKDRYNSFSKSRKKTKKSIRKAIMQQLGYMKRDLKIIDQIAVLHPEYLQVLSKWEQEWLAVIRILYAKQQEMFSTNIQRVEDRIINLSQPWMRPIKRGNRIQIRNLVRN